MTSKRAEILYFCLLTIIFTFLLFFVSAADIRYSTGGSLTVSVKAALAAGCILFLIRRREENIFTCRPFSPVILAAALIPAVFTVARTFCRFDLLPGFPAVISGVADVILTALWEELFFRGIGARAFREGEEPFPGRPILLSLIFAFAHLVNVLGGPPLAVLLQMLLAFCTGLLFLGLFGSAGLPAAVLSHLLMDLAAETVLLFASEEAQAGPYLSRLSWPLFAVQCTVTLAAGLLLLLRRPEVKNAERDP